MPRAKTIRDDDVLEKLSDVFRDVGYEGASLSLLSKATGLQKASLYHRFPEGKEQMAREVLAAAEKWLNDHVLTPLRGDIRPADRVDAMVKNLDKFYAGGRQACLLNLLSSPLIQKGPFTSQIKRAFQAWTEALTTVVKDAGFKEAVAHERAERIIMLLQGSLVLSRGRGTPRPFKSILEKLPDELLGVVLTSTERNANKTMEGNGLDCA